MSPPPTILVPENAIHWIIYRALTEIRGYKKAISSQIVATKPFHSPFSALIKVELI